MSKPSSSVNDDVISVTSDHTSTDAEEQEEWLDDTASMVEESINDNDNEHATYDHALFYANFNAKHNNRNGILPLHCRIIIICISIALGLIVSGIIIKVVTSNPKSQPNAVVVLEGDNDDDESLLPVTSQPPPTVPPTTTNYNANNNGNDADNNDNSRHAVDFDHRHNVEYDGVKIFKNNTKGIDTYNWDAYAKTTQPITELDFAAGDTHLTKYVVLTFDPYAGYEYGTLDEEAIPNPGESAVVIGMYSEGALWLPPNHNGLTYTMEDLFTLSVVESEIILYLNNEVLTTYNNPYGANHPLFAQVWLKEPNASVLTVASRKGQ
jgi:hypothetical protein